MKENGIHTAAFGDIFLEDLRKYREEQLKKVGVDSVFPLWQQDTKSLMSEFLTLGFQTKTVAANAKYFDKNIVGQDLTLDLINSFPKEVDPCGENGEFHTFCFDGPIFKEPVKFVIGEKVKKSYPNPQTN